METAATEHRACTCHPSEAPRVCQRKFALHDCRIAEGQALYDAIGVQPGRAELHGDIVRVVLPDGKSCQHLVYGTEEEIGEFLAWVFNHFTTLTER